MKKEDISVNNSYLVALLLIYWELNKRLIERENVGLLSFILFEFSLELVILPGWMRDSAVQWACVFRQMSRSFEISRLPDNSSGSQWGP